jgi:hypothetical protein
VDVTVNGETVVLGKADQTNGLVTITSNNSLVTVRYDPGQGFPERSEVTVRVVCRDLASPANVLDSTYAFEVGVSQIIPTMVNSVDPSGEDLVDDATGIGMSIPEGAVNDSVDVSVGVAKDPPVMPDSMEGIGLCYYLGPDGFRFCDSVLLHIPYTPSDLRNSGAEGPQDLPLCFFSIREGSWKRIRPFETDGEAIVVKVLELGYFILGRAEGTGCERDGADEGIPKDCALRQSYPNPFNAETVVCYELPGEGMVRLDIYDSSGRKVRTLVNGYRTAGSHSVEWNGKDDRGMTAATGMYICWLRAGIRNRISKVVYAK